MISIKKAVLSLALGCASIAAGAQTTWTDSVTVGTKTAANNSVPTKFKVWVPTGVTNPKGIILASGATDSRLTKGRPFTISPEIRAAATNQSLVIVGFWTANADTALAVGFNPTLNHQDSLAKALTLLGSSTSLNLTAATVITFGHGRGAGFAQQYAMFAPTKVAAVISYHGFNIVNPAWVSTAPYSPAVNNLKLTPHAVISAELEGPEINNNRRPYLSDTMRFFSLQRRTQNELVHQVVEMNGNHLHANRRGYSYLGVFIEKTAQVRMQTAGTLAPVTEAGGYLGRALRRHEFELANYPTQAFSAGAAATNFWFYDAAHAGVWAQFHQTPIRIGLQPPPLPVAPYISGRNVSGMAITYDLADRSFASFGDSNIIRIELSNALGDFSSRNFPSLIAGSTLRRDTTGYTAATSAGSSSGFLEVPLPDNLQYDILNLRTTRPRYRVRLSTTHPELESHNAGEIGDFIIGDSYNMWLSALPAGSRLSRGKEVRVVLNKLATFNTNPGNRFLLQLSDSAGVFDNATLLNDTTASITGSSLVLRGTIPTNIIGGYRFRIRVKSTNPVDSSGNNGSDLTLGSIISDLSTEGNVSVATKAVSIFPNPATDLATLSLDFADAGLVNWSVVNTNGQVVLEGTEQKQAGFQQLNLRTTNLVAGVYLVRVQSATVKTAVRLLVR